MAHDHFEHARERCERLPRQYATTSAGTRTGLAHVATRVANPAGRSGTFAADAGGDHAGRFACRDQLAGGISYPVPQSRGDGSNSS